MLDAIEGSFQSGTRGIHRGRKSRDNLGAEPDQLVFCFALIRCIVGIYVGRDFVLARPAVADHRGKNENSFLTAFDESAKRVPRPDSSNVSGIRLLSGNQHHIAERVGMESHQRRQLILITVSRMLPIPSIAGAVGRIS